MLAPLRGLKPYKLLFNSIQLFFLLNIETTYITLELNDVIALFNRDSLSLSATGVDIVVSISNALAAAFSKDSEMVVG